MLSNFSVEKSCEIFFMMTQVPVNVNNGKDRFMQKCVVPLKFLERTNLVHGDYVTIQTSSTKFICRIYTTLLPYQFIYVDNLVTSVKFQSSEGDQHCETINFPDSLTCFKPCNFERVSVKIVYKSDMNVFHCDKAIYEDAIRKILKSCVFEHACAVHCNGHEIADFFHIHFILIAETFPETFKHGKINKFTKIELVDLLSLEQKQQNEEFQCIRLGGINETLNILKSYMCQTSSRVLVSGPPGTGKSSRIKKFCSDINCSFVIIDGLKEVDIMVNKCDRIYNHFHNYLKIFMDRPIILFIDHIDILAPSGIKQKSATIAMLVNLINRLNNLNVLIIASAGHRKNINPQVSSLFVKEVNLGMPSFKQRKEIVKILTESLDCDIDYNKVSQMTPGFVGHDISLLITEASKCRKNSEVSDVTCLRTEDFEKALNSVSPSVIKTSVWNMKVKPVYWKDIGGMFHIKHRLQMCIEWPLRNPENFKKVDLPCPHGVLLFGPPGCCKTTLARGLATECKANFFSATPAQIYSPYVGESEKNITELFYQARLSAPSIIFLDEIDSLVSQRKMGKKQQGIGEKVLSALLNEMDGFGTKVQSQSSLAMQKLINSDEAITNLSEKFEVEQHSNDDVIVVAATNRPDLIDDALLRPGRFDIIMYVSPPNEEERQSILQTLTKDKPIKDVDMKKIAEKTQLFSGADLKSLCNEAAMNALRHNMSALYITEDNFNEALDKMHPSITKQQIEMYEKLSSKYGTFIK